MVPRGDCAIPDSNPPDLRRTRDAMIALAPAEVLDRSQPAVRGWFAERFGVPTDARVDGWPSIFERHDVLLAAPTVPGGTGALAARTTAGGSVCVGGAPMAATWSRNFRAAGSSGIQSPLRPPQPPQAWPGSTTSRLSVYGRAQELRGASRAGAGMRHDLLGCHGHAAATPPQSIDCHRPPRGRAWIPGLHDSHLALFEYEIDLGVR